MLRWASFNTNEKVQAFEIIHTQKFRNTAKRVCIFFKKSHLTLMYYCLTIKCLQIKRYLAYFFSTKKTFFYNKAYQIKHLVITFVSKKERT